MRGWVGGNIPSYRSNHHAHDFEAEKYNGQDPVVLVECRGGDAKAIETQTTKDELRNDEDETKLGLVDTPVSARHGFGTPVGEQRCEQEAKEGTDECARVRVTSLHLVPEQRGTNHDGCQDDADEDGPADQRAMDECRPVHVRWSEEWSVIHLPEDAWVEKERKRSEEELPQTFVRLAAGEDVKFLDEGFPLGIGEVIIWHGMCIIMHLRLVRFHGMQTFCRVVVGGILRNSRRQINLKPGRSLICHFGHKEEHQRQTDAGTNGNHIKGPWPANLCRDLAHQDGGEESTSKGRQIGNCHADTAFLSHQFSSC